MALIIGIDEGGATVQGLRAARDLFDTVHVFHEPGNRTFHPKVYLLHDDRSAFLLVGSTNLTAGGLYSNYEASLIVELDLSLDADITVYNEVLAWFDHLYNETELCLELTPERMEELIADPRYRIGDEDHRRATRNETESDESDEDPTLDEPGASMFGRARQPRGGTAPPLSSATTRSAPQFPANPAAPHTTPTQPTTDAPTPAQPTPDQLLPAQPIFRWWKRMSRTDAQAAPTGTNVTGHLKLTKAGHDINHKEFFRLQFFRGAHWSSEHEVRGAKETTVCNMQVIFDGGDLGAIPLRIDHAEFRVAEQNNVPTWLHWGELSERLRNHNYTGFWVILTHLSDGTYRLEITRTEPTP